MGCNQTDSIADFGIFRKVYDNFYLLEKVAISVITDKAMNISNEKAMEIVDNFKNFIEAFPILYKSTRICGYLSRTKTNDVLSSFMNLLFDDLHIIYNNAHAGKNKLILKQSNLENS